LRPSFTELVLEGHRQRILVFLANRVEWVASKLLLEVQEQTLQVFQTNVLDDACTRYFRPSHLINAQSRQDASFQFHLRLELTVASCG
jgi:hypothetical protein